MHDSSDGGGDSPSVVSIRTMEIVTALLLLVVSTIVVYGAFQIGAGWREDGPGPGFFPFYVGLIMGVASMMNLLAALRHTSSGHASFVSRSELSRVIAVFIPTVIYVALIGEIGIYVASFLFITGFMVAIGREPIWKALLVGASVPIVAFFMFERWFKVALPKGPLERLLGLA